MKKLLYINTIATDKEKDKGVKNKIKGQLKAVEKLGYQVDYLERVRKEKKFYFTLNNLEISNTEFKRNFLSQIMEFFYYPNYKNLVERINSQKYDLVYFRRFILTFGSMKFIRAINGKKKIWEIPTYPYDNEAIFIKDKILYFFERIFFRKKLKNRINKIVTYSDDRKIFGIHCINISNGIDLEEVKLVEKKEHRRINFINVSNCSFWHGIDRFLYSLLQYKKNGGKEQVKFHIVGEGSEAPKLKKIVEDNIELQDIVIFYGFKSGEELDEVYNNSDIAVGCLGNHRKNIEKAFALKNREYCAKGLPLIFSEIDLDFEECKFVYKVSADESLLDIENIIEWYKNLKVTPEEIRKYAEDNLSWDKQMKKVIDNI